MSAPLLYAIHGNLQTPAVWEKFSTALRDGQGEPVTWMREDLWAARARTFAGWAEAFCQRVEQERRDSAAAHNGCAVRPWLLGYSLGGRLTLHALLHRPELWRGVIVVAAHPGLTDEADKTARLDQDRRWAERFRTEPWKKLLTEWNAQAVFQRKDKPVKNPRPPRESDFDREQVARTFETFSLGGQNDLRPTLAALYQHRQAASAPPLLVLTGEHDAKFRAFGDELAGLGEAITHRVVPGAGHRVPWEAPAAFTRAVQDFIGGKEPVLMA